MRLQNAYQVLALDPIASAPYANVSFFSSFRALSNQVGCWNWTDNTRGSLDDPWLLKPARLENTSEQFHVSHASQSLLKQLLKLGRPANSSRPLHANEPFLKGAANVEDRRGKSQTPKSKTETPIPKPGQIYI